MKSVFRKASKLLKLLAVPIYRRGLARGSAAAIEHYRALKCIEFGSVLDVGANTGQFSLLARRLRPTALIHAFEPLRGPAATYRRVFADDSRTVLHPFAAGSRSEDAEIYLSRQVDSSSLLPITDAQSAAFPGTGEVGREMVSVRRLDDILAAEDLPQPLLLKLDVQGFELAALQGMSRLLDRAAHVYAEASFVELYQGQPLAPEIIEWMQSRSFQLAGVYNPSYGPTGAAIQADFLFERCAGAR